MFDHILTRGWSSNGNGISKTTTISAGGESNLDESIPVSQTDLTVAFTADVSQIKSLYIVASGALEVHTNTISGVNDFILAANVPFLWAVGDAPLRDTAGVAVTTDITELHVVNASDTVAVTLQIRMLVDPTV